MTLINYFLPKERKQPTIKGYLFAENILNYDLSYEVYYKYYNLNPFIFMAINKRSKDTFSKGWELLKESEIGKEKQSRIYNDVFQKLIEYSTSNTPMEFLERIIRDYDISGNAYVYIVKDKNKNPIGLQILDPRYIKPVGDRFGQLLGYIQNLDGIKVFLKDEIYHMKNDNDIDNEIVGKSRMTSLFLDIETDQEARESNLAFFKNNQTPSSIIVIDPDFEIEGEDEIKYKEKIKEMFQTGKYQGGKNHHRSMMAQGIKDIIKIQDKISDMEYKELRIFTGDLVFGVYETPKSILGFTNGVNYNSGDNQYDSYWDNIEALGTKASVFLTEIFKVFDEEYVFVALKDNLRKLVIKAQIAGSLYKDKELLTRDEARELIQYQKTTDGDKFYESKGITISDGKTEK